MSDPALGWGLPPGVSDRDIDGPAPRDEHGCTERELVRERAAEHDADCQREERRLSFMKPKSNKTRQPDFSALGEILANAAFTSGDGVKASRLVFLLDNGREYGGWAEGALARHFAEVLEAKWRSDTTS